MKSQFTKERLKKFLSYYRPHRKIFIMDMFFAGLSSLTVVLFPLVSGYLTSEVLNEWDESTVHRLVICGVVLAALTGVKIISNIITTQKIKNFLFISGSFFSITAAIKV